MIARLYLLVWIQFCLSSLCLFHSCSDGNIRQTELLAVHSELFGCSKEFSCLKCLEAYVLHESANNMLDLRQGTWLEEIRELCRWYFNLVLAYSLSGLRLF